MGGNKETMSASHFLENSNANNHHTEIEKSVNRNNRQKSGKTVNNKHNIFELTQFQNKWLSNITDSIYLVNSMFSQQIFDSQYTDGIAPSMHSAIPFFQASNKNDEIVGRSVPAAKLINSQARRSKHDNNDDEVNAFMAQKQKLAKVIFFSFATLHEFLTDADQNLSLGSSTNSQNEGENINYEKGNKKYNNLVLNSRIISASIDEKSLRRRSHKKYFYDTTLSEDNHDSSSSPQAVVSIRFSHIHEQMSDPICVFWDNEKEAWSNHGCRVVESSQSMTTCQCQHLTHFALLMKFPDDMDINSIGSGIIFDSDVYLQRNKDSTTSTVITLEVATYIISTVCLIILILLIIQVSKSFHIKLC